MKIKNKNIEVLVIMITVIILLLEAQIIFSINGINFDFKIVGIAYMIPVFVTIHNFIFYNKDGGFKYD